MDDLRFYVFLNSISVIIGQWADDNKRPFAMESLLRLNRFRHKQDSLSGTAKSAGQHSTH